MTPTSIAEPTTPRPTTGASGQLRPMTREATTASAPSTMATPSRRRCRTDSAKVRDALR